MARPVAEVEHVEVAPLRSVGGELLPAQGGPEVVEEDGSLADGENPESGERVPAECDRVRAAEDPVVVRAPEVAVHPQGAVVAGGEAGAGEDVRRVDARGGEDEVGPDLLSVFQDGAAVHRDALSTQDQINP